MDLTGKTLLITGGTGSFGSTFIRTVLADHDVASVRVFSRDELKQYDLDRTLRDPRLRLLIGDVRDRDRLRVATRGVDVIVHAAALKQVPVVRVQPVRGRPDQRHRGPERHLGRDRQRASRSRWR